MHDVITVGSGLVDAFVYTGVKESKGRISFPVGTKILINNIVFSVGGGGTNSAAAFSRLGLRTGFLGKIGKGYNSKIILRELEKNKVDFLGVQTDEHAGYSLILETNKKRRTILTFKGASDNLKYSEVNFKKLKTKWFHFTSTGSETFKTQKKLMSYAKKNNIKVSFNPSSYQVKLGKNYLSKLIKNSDFISLNQEEARILTGKRDNLFQAVHSLGPEIVSITHGDKSGGIYDGKFLYKYWPNKVKVSELTGAGDVFSSSFVSGLITFKSIGSAIKLAMANCESVIQKRGAKEGLLTLAEAKESMKKKTFKVKKELL